MFERVCVRESVCERKGMCERVCLCVRERVNVIYTQISRVCVECVWVHNR